MWRCVGCLMMLCSMAQAAAPRAAAMLGGSASVDLRQFVAGQLQAKLAGDGDYAVDVVPMSNPALAKLNAGSPQNAAAALAGLPSPDLLVWGQVDGRYADEAGPGVTIKLNLFDQRQLDPLPHTFSTNVGTAVDLPAAIESATVGLSGVRPSALLAAAAAARDAAFADLGNPNLIANGTFADRGGWTFETPSGFHPIGFADAPPDGERAVLCRGLGDDAGNALMISVGGTSARMNSVSCASNAFNVEPGARYRLSFDYRTQGRAPTPAFFGFHAPPTRGIWTLPHVYRRQIFPPDAPRGPWTPVTADIVVPLSVSPPKVMCIDLAANITPGTVAFRNVVLKRVEASPHLR